MGYVVVISKHAVICRILGPFLHKEDATDCATDEQAADWSCTARWYEVTAVDVHTPLHGLQNLGRLPKAWTPNPFPELVAQVPKIDTTLADIGAHHQAMVAGWFRETRSGLTYIPNPECGNEITGGQEF